MKKITLTIISLMMVFSSFAYDFGGKVKTTLKSPTSLPTMPEEGNMVFSIGYGVPNLTKSLYSAYDSYTNFSVTGIGPLHFKFEYFLSESFGVGLVVNYVNTSATWKDENFAGILYKTTYNYSSLAFNMRFNWHFYTNDHFDIYGGSGIGYRVNKYEYIDEDPNGLTDWSRPSFFPLGFELTVGMRYFFMENIGVYMEVGAAKSILQFGVAIKI
jgi:hypothetical protein